MDLQRLPLANLADKCRDETEHFRHGVPYRDDYCFEIIRRAVCTGDAGAWQAFEAQYRGVVLAWIRRHPAATSCDEDDGYWINRTFERFWRAVGPERFELFPTLAALLRYLKMCAHCALLDELRSREATRAEPLPDQWSPGDDARDVETTALDALSGKELWAAVGRELQDDAERTVAYLCFALGLKPQQVHERLPDRYSTVADVYRIKRNVLDRLRRSPEIREYLG